MRNDSADPTCPVGTEGDASAAQLATSQNGTDESTVYFISQNSGVRYGQVESPVYQLYPTIHDSVHSAEGPMHAGLHLGTPRKSSNRIWDAGEVSNCEFGSCLRETSQCSLSGNPRGKW